MASLLFVWCDTVCVENGRGRPNIVADVKLATSALNSIQVIKSLSYGRFELQFEDVENFIHIFINMIDYSGPYDLINLFITSQITTTALKTR
jgi:hypothetical protein